MLPKGCPGPERPKAYNVVENMGIIPPLSQGKEWKLNPIHLLELDGRRVFPSLPDGDREADKVAHQEPAAAVPPTAGEPTAAADLGIGCPAMRATTAILATDHCQAASLSGGVAQIAPTIPGHLAKKSPDDDPEAFLITFKQVTLAAQKSGPHS